MITAATANQGIDVVFVSFGPLGQHFRADPGRMSG
jgi:hypothetical protein